MSQLNQNGGQALRRQLDSSATERLRSHSQMHSDSLQDQQQRQEANALRAAEVARDALSLQSKLEVQRENRTIQAEQLAKTRHTGREDLQKSIQRTLGQHQSERTYGGATRALQRAQERLGLSNSTKELLAQAAGTRAELRSDLEQFAAAMRSTTITITPQRAAKPVAKVTLVATPAKGSLGAMQNPEPMTAIQRRRENMLIKMIAANPGIRLIDLVQNLFLETAELKALLNALKSQHKIVEIENTFRLSARTP